MPSQEGRKDLPNRAATRTVGAAGEVGLKSRRSEAQEEELARLRAKVGELTMDNELLFRRIHEMEAGRPFALRRSRP